MMTHEIKIKYMRIAAGICSYGFTDEQLDLLISLYELVLEKEGETDLNSISNVEQEVKQRAKEKSRIEKEKVKTAPTE